MQNSSIPAYLQRIGYSGPLDPTPETLRELHKAHILSVPFENLDIHLGRLIVLDEAAFLEKIVRNHRGGFCYELNGAFAGLLKALGFAVSMLSAGVARKEGGFGPEFDHMALLVKLEESWLVDIGFGDGFIEPLLLEKPGDQQQECGTFRIESDGVHRVLIRSTRGGPWRPQYRFTLQPRQLDDYREMCLYHQSSPGSSFTQGRIVTLATPHGRVTVSERRLITTDSEGGRTERELATEAEYRQVLMDLFAIRLDQSH